MLFRPRRSVPSSFFVRYFPNLTDFGGVKVTWYGECIVHNDSPALA